MAQQQARQEEGSANLNFITFGEPAQSRSTRAIRSHAAKAGWKQRKKNAIVAPLPVRAEQTPIQIHGNLRVVPRVPSWPVGTAGIAHRTTPSLSSSSSRSSLSSTVSSCSTPLDTLPPGIDALVIELDSSDPQSEDGNVEGLHTQLQYVDSQWHSPKLFYRPVGAGHDPFSQFPVQWKDPFGSLVHFYRECLGEVWLKVIAANWGKQGNCEFRDFPLKISVAQQEPAIFYAVMSNSSVMAPSSNAISMRQQPYLSQWLRHKAVGALRDAIADPKRAYTDAVICTVDFVYVNEALRGEVETAQSVHGPALKRMVAKRGGLRTIASNGKDGLILSRMLTWADRIVASSIDVPMLFPDYTEDPSLEQTQWTGIWDRVQTMM